jgi:hypothetical protein
MLHSYEQGCEKRDRKGQKQDQEVDLRKKKTQSCAHDESAAVPPEGRQMGCSCVFRGGAYSAIHFGLISTRELVQERKRDDRSKEQNHRGILGVPIEEKSSRKENSEDQHREAGGFVLNGFRENRPCAIEPILEVKWHSRDSGNAGPDCDMV